MLTISLAFLAATVAVVAQPQTPPRLPQSISGWEYFSTPGVEKQFHGGRFWDRAFLRQAVRASHWDRSMGQVLTKLHAGQPIVVMALGSSITANFGGHFQRLPNALAAIVPAPVVHNRFGEKMEGFLQMFMSMVNRTFPHPDHLLYNSGWPGTSFYVHASASCMEATLPNVTVDVLIAEHLPRRLTYDLEFSDSAHIGNTQELEQFMWRISAHYKTLNLSPPPYVFLKPLTFDYNLSSFRECPLSGCPTALCSHFQGPYSQPDRNASQELLYEGRMQGIARHYGQTLVSFNYLLYAARRSETVGNMSDCNLARRLYADTLHPSRLGQVLYADLLINLLADAEGEADLLSASTAAAGSLRGGLRPPRTPPPQAWEGNAAQTVTSNSQLATWDSSVQPGMQVDQPTPPAAGAAGVWKPRTMPMYALTAAGQHAWRMRCYGEADRDSGLLIVQQSGWVHVVNQTHVSNPTDAPKRKPGWVGSTVGAFLQFQVDSSFSGDDISNNMLPANATVALLLLQSYEHMGMARVACVKNCVCPAILINAHHQEEVSISAVHELPRVTPHPQCLLEVKILPNSTSPGGEHKFKLVQVVVKSLM